MWAFRSECANLGLQFAFLIIMNVMKNIALEKAREAYAQVEKRYIEALQEKGLKFAEPHAYDEECAQLRDQLADRGVIVRNAGASLSVGHLSPACVGCTDNVGSETFSTTFKCHRDCYFCFNKNQPDYEFLFKNGCPWEERLEQSSKENGTLACIGLTGGEPLLDVDESVRFIERAKALHPSAHIRMYTSGDLLDKESAAKLRDAGLQEMRFSVKDDDTREQQEKVLRAMRLAKEYIPSVMVEMPVAPNAEEHMKWLLEQFNEIGIDGINLLELCFPFCNWEEFEKRGFLLKNPPFEVMYDYGYSGGLAVAGSEALILKLMLWCLDNGIDIGLHYCSLENKHRSEIRIKNERAREILPYFTFDEGDFFLKLGKIFGPDVEVAKAALEDLGCGDMREDEDEQSLAFPLDFAEAIKDVQNADGQPIQIQVCYFVYEIDDDGGYLIDIALEDYAEPAA